MVVLNEEPAPCAAVVFVEAGAGVYDFRPGCTELGAHAGAGAQLEASPETVLGVPYMAHAVFTSGSNTTFSSLRAGGRLRFETSDWLFSPDGCQAGSRHP